MRDHPIVTDYSDWPYDRPVVAPEPLPAAEEPGDDVLRATYAAAYGPVPPVPDPDDLTAAHTAGLRAVWNAARLALVLLLMAGCRQPAPAPKTTAAPDSLTWEEAWDAHAWGRDSASQAAP